MRRVECRGCSNLLGEESSIEDVRSTVDRVDAKQDGDFAAVLFAQFPQTSLKFAIPVDSGDITAKRAWRVKEGTNLILLKKVNESTLYNPAEFPTIFVVVLVEDAVDVELVHFTEKLVEIEVFHETFCVLCLLGSEIGRGGRLRVEGIEGAAATRRLKLGVYSTYKQHQD